MDFLHKHEIQESQRKVLNREVKESRNNAMDDAILNAKIRREKEINLKAQSVKNKHSYLDRRKMKKEEEEARKTVFMKELKSLKSKKIKDNIGKLDGIMEYKCKKNTDKLNYLTYRVNEFMINKDHIQKEKILKNQLFEMRRKDMGRLYSDLLNRTSAFSLNRIKEIFPGDDDIINKLIKLKMINSDLDSSFRSYYGMNRTSMPIKENSSSNMNSSLINLKGFDKSF